MPLATTDCPRSLRRTPVATAHLRARRSSLKTTAPELSIPADYTAECSDELIMDDATADNCGEVTIEVSSETTAGDCDSSYIVTHVHCDGRRGNSITLRPSRLRTRRHLSSRAFPPTTRWSALTRCPWMTHRQTTTLLSIRERDDCRRCRWQPQLSAHLHRNGRLWRNICEPDDGVEGPATLNEHPRGLHRRVSTS